MREMENYIFCWFMRSFGHSCNLEDGCGRRAEAKATKQTPYLPACLLSLALSPRRDAALTFGNEKHFFRCKTFLERRAEAEAEEEGAAELCVFPRPSERLGVRGREMRVRVQQAAPHSSAHAATQPSGSLGAHAVTPCRTTGQTFFLKK